MTMTIAARKLTMICAVFGCSLVACSSDSPPPSTGPELTGQSCMSAAECYPGLDAGSLMGGGPVCLANVSGGYCTHVCTADTDCCAVAGECLTAHPEVCAPFESMPQSYCFLSCEPADIADAGLTDADAFCNTFAHTGFSCRSTGGGANNRRICAP